MRTEIGAMFSLFAFALGCGRPASGGDDPPQLERPAMVRFHMQRHFDDLREIERLLLAGKLDEAKARAFLLTKPAQDPGIAQWNAESARLTAAAQALVKASDVDEALRREARVAGACGACHVETQRGPVFEEPPAVPRDEGTPESRLARHRWAVDRLWEGIASGVGRWWLEGLEVLGSTEPPSTGRPEDARVAARFQALAREVHGAAPGTADARARRYGDILVTCARCHAPAAARARSP